jgi:hypothetical protein
LATARVRREGKKDCDKKETVMSAAELWKSLGEPFERLRRHIKAADTTNITARGLRDEAQALAEYFFGEVRPALVGLLDEELK